MNRLKEVKKQVECILQKYPAARDNDKLLVVYVLSEFYKIRFIVDILKPNVPTPESIRRARQKIQAEGKYPSSNRTQKIRAEVQEVYKEFAVTK